MKENIWLDSLVAACADASFEDGLRIGHGTRISCRTGGPVKPAVYKGGRYQEDRRWPTPSDEDATPVIVIDNVPSQANRLEDALRRHRATAPVPELVLDLSELAHLPAHLPSRISSLQFLIVTATPTSATRSLTASTSFGPTSGERSWPLPRKSAARSWRGSLKRSSTGSGNRTSARSATTRSMHEHGPRRSSDGDRRPTIRASSASRGIR